jgi:ElaB/YqjD/DUF883 family membrane-anchored ribosome-binding protein
MRHTKYPYKDNSYESPDKIQEDIQQTRAEMNHTLHALERRLSPGQLTDQFLSYFRGAGEESGEFVTNLGRSIRDNPVPITLLGIGLGWLMIADSEKPKHHYSQSYQGPIITPSSTHREKTASEKIHEKAGQMTHGVREKTEQMAHGAREKTEQMAHGAREKVEQVTETARHQFQQLSDRAHYQAEKAKRGFTDMFQEHPLVLGGIGLAIGAALGAGLPSTRREDELMGEKRDELVEQAKAKGREQLDKAEHIAGAAQEAAREEAQRQGFTAEATGAERGGQESASSAPREDQAHRQGSSENARKEAKQQDLGSASLSSR